MCPIFDGSQSNSLTRYQKIFWGYSFVCKNLSNSTCLTLKVHNCTNFTSVSSLVVKYFFSQECIYKPKCNYSTYCQKFSKLVVFAYFCEICLNYFCVWATSKHRTWKMRLGQFVLHSKQTMWKSSGPIFSSYLVFTLIREFNS